MPILPESATTEVRILTKNNYWAGNFIKKLIKSSESDIYNEAIKEWELSYTYLCDEYGDERCICTHEIQEVCVVKNKINNNILKIGNCCIVKFDVLGGNDLIKAIRNLKKNKFNASSINLFFELGYINEETRDFIMNIKNRPHTDKQYRWRMDILNRLKNRLIGG